MILTAKASRRTLAEKNTDHHRARKIDIRRGLIGMIARPQKRIHCSRRSSRQISPGCVIAVSLLPFHSWGAAGGGMIGGGGNDRTGGTGITGAGVTATGLATTGIGGTRSFLPSGARAAWVLVTTMETTATAAGTPHGNRPLQPAWECAGDGASPTQAGPEKNLKITPDRSNPESFAR